MNNRSPLGPLRYSKWQCEAVGKLISIRKQDFNMHFSTIVSCVVGTFIAILFSSVARASIISCPPNPLQEQVHPALRQVCDAIEQAIVDISQQQAFAGRLEERNTNMNAKRQDVDHVFLRFGRRF
ncbi:hypothetical protein JTB14_030828 [Gonioctena quinquepunctata]|nr:hypothetical protein JTB14_030828 [Gonioctena quinquepunctata]